MNNEFWTNVKNLIKENNTYQDWIANKCGVKPRTFQNWIYRNIPPNVIDGQKIAVALETTVEYLVTGKPPADMPKDIIEIIKAAKKLNDEGKKAALGAIQGLQALYPQNKEEETVYSDTQPVALETKEVEPAYPQPFKVQNRPETDGTDTPKFENDVEFFDWEMVMIPYFGKTAAGKPLDISIPPDEYMPFPRQALKGDPNDYFYLTIQGYSMVDAGINEGDLVVIRKAEEPINGEIMLVRHENASTLKKIVIKKDKIYLCWEDGSGKRLLLDSRDFEVQGILVWITKRPKK
jgi:SOS-response transcriptional repressor LexA